MGAVMFWCFTGKLQRDCDHVAIASFAHYLRNDVLLGVALKECYLGLNVENVLKVCQLYTRLKVRHSHGLDYLAGWIENKKDDGTINDKLYKEIAYECPFVENIV